MKKAYNNFISKYPAMTNPEISAILDILKTAVNNSSTLHKVQLGSKSRRLSMNLPYNFRLNAEYIGKDKHEFQITVYSNNIKCYNTIIQPKDIYYIIDNIKILVEYGMMQRKQEIDLYLPLYNQIHDIRKIAEENVYSKTPKNNSYEQYDEILKEQQRLLSLDEYKHLIEHNVILAKESYSWYSSQDNDKLQYEVNRSLFSDLFFKELSTLIRFGSLINSIHNLQNDIKDLQNDIKQKENNINNLIEQIKNFK